MFVFGKRKPTKGREGVNDRNKTIGASDARRLLTAPFELWLEKTGRELRADLSGIFSVQLGRVTEALNLDWYERVSGNQVTRRGENVVSLAESCMSCTLDGLIEAVPAVIEAKHVHSGSSRDGVIGQYAAQVQHQMFVMGVPNGILSVIIGTAEPALWSIARDDWWLDDYVKLCRRFWACVESDTAPDWGTELEAPVAKADRVVDMTKETCSVEWEKHARDWVVNRMPAERFTRARDAIKSMIPSDVRQATGGGIIVTRDGRARLHIKEA